MRKEFPQPEEPEDINRPASASPTEQELDREMPGGIDSRGYDPYSALRYPDYRRFAAGWIACVIGQQVQSVAVQWQLFHRAQSVREGALALGLVGGVQALPVILLAIPAGQLADRVDRRKILLCTQIGAILCSLGLAAAASTTSPLWLIYLLLGLSAASNASGWPARSALLPQLVPAEAFSNATTWNSSGYQIASVAGPALGGLVVAFSVHSAFFAFSVRAAFLIDAGCGLMFLLLLLAMHPEPIVRKHEAATLKTALAGARFVWREKMILAIITLDLFAVLLGGATYLIPAFASTILHVGPVGFGWLRAAPAFGALAMAVAIAHRPPMRHAGVALLRAVALFGVATIIFGISRWFFISFLMLALTGAFDNVSIVVRHTLVQMLTPEQMRGRVSAVNSIFIGASNEIGGLESGLTAFLFGPVASVVAGGVGTILVVIAVALIWPQVARFGSLADARPIDVSAGAA